MALYIDYSFIFTSIEPTLKIMFKILNCMIVILLSFSSIEINAAHIIGGDVTYSCISSDQVNQTTTFNVVFTIYRDASGGGAQFDIPANFGLYSSSDEMNWEFNQRITENIESIVDVDFSDPCVTFPPNLAVEKGVYTFEITLPWDNNVYKIAYQRCCRNNTINNLVDPGSTGAVYSIDFYPEAITNCNNSPVFNTFPPIIICLDEDIDYSSGATDLDSDVIEYELCTPFTAGGTDGATTPGSATSCTGVTPDPQMCIPPFDNVLFQLPLYNTLNPLGMSANVNIDPMTGFLTGVPDALGQYVVGICINEYRDGKLLSRVRRDFQFNVAECIMPEGDLAFEICPGDSTEVNGVFYDSSGIFEQEFQTADGCDSTLNIVVSYLESDTSNIEQTICEGGSVVINGQTFDSEGFFQQDLTTASGCDSIILIKINVLPTTYGAIDLMFCEGSEIEVNGEVYVQGGEYVQTLTNINGCDSVLTITIDEWQITETVLNYSLCKVSEVVVNNTSYTNEGQYIQTLDDQNGCDSVLVINITNCIGEIGYDFELCNSFGINEAMDYSEFIPQYNMQNLCGSISATNVYRENAPENKHSCTEGNNGSVTMCISALDTCEWIPHTDKAIVVEILLDSIEDGSSLGLSNFSFYHKSPLQFDWIDGPEGLNNYPQKFNIRIFRNLNLIYEEGDLDCANDWTNKTINFNGLNDFIVQDSTVFRFEITPYCLVGNESEVAAWDVDDFDISFSCFDSELRQVAGRIMNFNLINEPVIIEAKNADDLKVVQTTSDNEGHFIFENLDTDKDYVFDVMYNKQILNRISQNDLEIIKSHILSLSPFTTNYQYFAADANNDQRITMTDVNLLRRLLVGMDSELKWNKTWRFYDASQLSNDLLPDWEKLNVRIKKSAKHIQNLEIIPIKIGDLDGLE